MTFTPIQKPGKSKQDYCTPPTFIKALERKLGIVGFSIDLAASKENAICPQFYSEKDDSLMQPWFRGTQWGFCNPPFLNILPWVTKANVESAIHGTQVAMLVPASVGSNWWLDEVHDAAHVLFVSPRLTFVGAEDPYPKDCAILLYTPIVRGGYECWRWK